MAESAPSPMNTTAAGGRVPEIQGAEQDTAVAKAMGESRSEPGTEKGSESATFDGAHARDGCPSRHAPSPCSNSQLLPSVGNRLLRSSVRAIAERYQRSVLLPADKTQETGTGFASVPYPRAHGRRPYSLGI